MGAINGRSNNNSTTTPTTTNTDNRVAAQDSIVASGGASLSNTTNTNTTNIDNSNSSDAVIAIANAGTSLIRDSGEAVVNLAELQFNANAQTWNRTVTESAALIDKLIGQSGAGIELGRQAARDNVSLANNVIGSFKPVEGQQTEVMKWALGAAALIAASVMFKGSK